MAKILKIDEDIITIGTDDGKMREVRREDLNFEPKVNDNIEIYEGETSIIVAKKEEPQSQASEQGININVQNTQGYPNNGQPIYVANGTKAVNKVVYCILAFFLGGLGIYNMYAGKVGTGIVYLLFCWTIIPSIIAFIDFIIGLCKHADSNGNILV